jgi:hypothetical protein
MHATTLQNRNYEYQGCIVLLTQVLDGIGVMISLTHHADCQTIGSYIFGCNGETWVFATGEEIVANRKNEMNIKAV